MQKYPKIDANNFYTGINKIFSKYTIPKEKKTLKEVCFPKSYQHQIPQQFVSNYIHPSTPYKSLLIFHRIGAGKTCSAISIAEEWKHLRRIIVVLPASLKGNFRNELRSECAYDEYLKKAERAKLKTLHPSDSEYKDIIEKSDARIDKYYDIYSYNKFVELCQSEKKSERINFHNKVLIVDEIQNMVSEHGSFYKILYGAIHNAPKDLRVVLLSATPIFDHPSEIALTFNLLRIPIEIPIGAEFHRRFLQKKVNKGIIYYVMKNAALFKSLIKGYCSFFNGADPKFFPGQDFRIVRCKMEDFQYKTYLSVLHKDFENTNQRLRAFQDGDILNLPNNFFLGPRMVSNVCFPNKGIHEDGFSSFTGKYLKLKNLKNYSIKFYKILQKIKRCSGTVFVYSNFKGVGGIQAFCELLLAHNYRPYSEHGEGYRTFGVWSGTETMTMKDEIRAVFNQKSNADGSKMKILIGSPAIKEGVSLLRVQQVHIMEPYWNTSRINQIIGRAVRFCSHATLPKDRQMVRVYLYLAVHEQSEETIDEYIQRLAFHKGNLTNEFELALKESAVDCVLNKNANVHPGENDIICVK